MRKNVEKSNMREGGLSGNYRRRDHDSEINRRELTDSIREPAPTLVEGLGMWVGLRF